MREFIAITASDNKNKRLRRYGAKTRVEEWFVNKYKTFPELDANIYLKKSFFDFIESGTDMENIREYLKRFPYFKCSYFDTYKSLVDFIDDLVKNSSNLDLKEIEEMEKIKKGFKLSVLYDKDYCIIGDIRRPKDGFLVWNDMETKCH